MESVDSIYNNGRDGPWQMYIQGSNICAYIIHINLKFLLYIAPRL